MVNNKQFAFTLAEVLITLSIVGIVAALTIPALIASVDKQQYVSAFKENYAILNQAFAKYAVDKGCSDIACTGLFSNAVSAIPNIWQDFVSDTLKVSKDCGISTNQDCFPDYEYDLSNISSIPVNSDNTVYKVLLSNGASVSFGNQNTNCNNFTSLSPSETLYYLCGIIILDVNGRKGPNKFGRDCFFSLAITKYHGVTPYIGSHSYDQLAGGFGWSYWKTASSIDDKCDPSVSGTNNGRACAARVIDEGWQMNY